MASIREGTRVTWEWGRGHAEGKVSEIFTQDVERTIKGQKIKRKASRDEPAYLILQEDGGRVLKSASEISRAS
ncbi:DUF2945 domain-containing protein [Pararhizobium arenae]|uniref:DUF2945 domain-containing protein n=1 Tax=Pararhizobium arenae TaxID=1856850 RepID=UPI0009F8FCA1|nr:DUF2945 domain-containing protein [Pararhizobium arenae]